MNRFRKIFLIITLAIFFIGIISPIFVFAENPPKTTAVYFCPQIDIPFIDMFDTKKYSCKEKDKEGNYTPAFKINTSSIAELAAGAYKFIAGIAGIAAVIVMMAGGYIWLFAGGNASKVGEAKSLIGSAVLGLFLVLGSYMILNLINPELIKLKSLDRIAGIKPISVSQTGNGASVDSSAAILCPLDTEVSAREKTKKDEGCGTVVSAKDAKSSQPCMRVSCLAGSVCIMNMEGELFSVIGSGCSKQITVLNDDVPRELSTLDTPLTTIKCGEIKGDGTGVYINRCGGDEKYTSCAIRTSSGEDIRTEKGGGWFFSSYNNVVNMKCERDDI